MRMRNLISSVSALLISGAFMIGVGANPAVAQEPNHNSGTLKIRVEHRLAKEQILTKNNISVVIGKRNMVLSGTVPTLYKKMEAARIVRRMARNLPVTNDLKLSAPIVKDSVIAANVMRRIQTQVPYTVFDWAEAGSVNGVVTLAGWVNNPLYVGMYERQAEHVIGVKKVINRLKYVFRYRHLARRAVHLIYRDGDSFPGASLQFNPPIHVIAVDGRIILEGNAGTSSFAAYLANRVRYHTNAIRVYNEMKSPA